MLRNEDLDRSRAKPEFVASFLSDLAWLGIAWQEGPDVGGPVVPYAQSERYSFYRKAFDRLKAIGCIYPCTCSRQDVLRASAAPHQEEEEPIYPGTCRLKSEPPPGARINWRFRVPDGERIAFQDGHYGNQTFIAGQDFGDFVVWRHDDTPSYQLAVVADDSAMEISEVVRGADLLLSTARQLLIYRALEQKPPAFFHCPLVLGEDGRRLAKRHDSASLKTLRERGLTALEVRQMFGTLE